MIEIKGSEGAVGYAVGKVVILKEQLKIRKKN